MSEESKKQDETGQDETRQDETSSDAYAAPAGGAADDVSDDARPENASERWVKYGLNVALTSLLVILLAFLVVWAAQRYRSRGDLTSAGSYSLKPQTVTVIGELKSPVKLVSLQPRLKQEEGRGRDGSGSASADQQDVYQPVNDILQEYKRKGKNIEVDSIDFVNNPAKLDLWLGEITRKYGGNIGAYRELLQSFQKTTLPEIKKLADAEAEKMKSLRGVQVADERQAETINAAYNTVLAFPPLIGTLTGDIQQELEEKLPDYKGRTQAVDGSMNLFSRQVEAVRKALDELQKQESAPQPVRDYAKNSLASYDAMKKQADDVLAKIKGLGELKLDEVRRRLVAPEGEEPAPAIAVMGENDIKLIDLKDVWKSGESTGLVGRMSGPPRRRFAGEQQLTAAILSLSQPQKTKVAFVRGGGPPKAGGMGPFGGGGGEYSEIADRLRAYNFEVLEKDVSGQAAQRSMMGGMPPPNEATDEQIKDAIWVVFAEPQMTQFGPMPGSPELANKLKEHLDRGGSAMCLFDLQGDDLSAALKDWGLEVKTNVIAVHEPVRTDADAGDDYIESARRQPPIFVINEYGGQGHAVTSTLQSLDAALVPMLPVVNKGADGAKVTPILPVPTNIPAWGEGDTAFLFNRRAPMPTYQADSGDLPPPLWAGAVVEKEGKGRVVAIGCSQFVQNGLLAIPDPRLSRQNLPVARFPGNSELFTNSIFWMAKMEKMIALSPAAMDTPRIAPMNKATLAFWRVGVLLVGLPALAVLSGFLVWRARRD